MNAAQPRVSPAEMSEMAQRRSNTNERPGPKGYSKIQPLAQGECCVKDGNEHDAKAFLAGATGGRQGKMLKLDSRCNSTT
jgi:hypothetical protein